MESIIFLLGRAMVRHIFLRGCRLFETIDRHDVSHSLGLDFRLAQVCQWGR